MNRNTYGLGETLLDIIFKNNIPQAAKAGGSTLNSCVSLGRAGVPVSFISETGDDKAGDIIIETMVNSSVKTDYVKRFSGGQTPTALAFLNEKNDAEYMFYKNYPTDRFCIELPEFKTNDILLFGSFFAISSEIRSKVEAVIKNAKKNGAIIIYDPNFRKPHLHCLGEVKKYIEENISLADIVRGSDEDFKLIFDANNSEEAYGQVKSFGCQNLIYTSADEYVKLHTEFHSEKYDVAKVEVISTIGAGDSFNAGLIYTIYNEEIMKDDIAKLRKGRWTKIIETAIKFGSHVCESYENYISEEFGRDI